MLKNAFFASPLSIVELDNKYVYVSGLIIIGLALFCVCVIGIGRKRHLILKERKTMYIKRAMVITFAIGFYDDSPQQPDIDGYLRDLDGVRHDIQNVRDLFEDKLKYDIYPDYTQHDINSYKIYWTEKEVIDILREKAEDLESNLQNETEPHYDGLIVIISCHGLAENIITSDYKTISKTAIHRIFSAKKPLRGRYRIFLFDCCSGVNEENVNLDLNMN